MTSQNTQEDAEGREEGKDEEVTPYLSGALLLTDKDKWTRNLAGKFPWLGTLSYSVNVKPQKE